MKRVIVSLVLLPLLPLLVFAQNAPYGQPGGMNTQQMMQQAQQMSVCMANIDRDKLEELAKQAQAMSEEIKALCQSGDESGALSTALEYSRSVRDEPVLKQLQECTKGMSQMMAQFMPVNPADVEARAESGGICD